MKIVFMGTPDIAAKVLASLDNSDNEVIGVICQPDKQVGRGNKIKYSEVKEYALSHGLYIMQPEKIRGNEELFNELKKLNADVFVVCAYGKILPKEILYMPKYGSINVHASLLPKLRGSSPIQSAILFGEEKTGITIMKMDEGMDTGDMILKDEVLIGNMTHEELYDTLSEMGGKLIIKALDLIEKGEATYEKQDESEATYVKLITKADGNIDFNLDAKSIERKIRAFDPWPGAYSGLNGTTIKFWKAEVSETIGNPGKIIEVTKDSIIIGCKDSSLVLKELQVPGKPRVSVKDYLLGHKVNVGDTFG